MIMHWILHLFLGAWALLALIALSRYRRRQRGYARLLGAAEEVARIAQGTPQPKPTPLGAALFGLTEALRAAEQLGDRGDAPRLELPHPWRLYTAAEAVLADLASWDTALRLVAAVDEAREGERLAEEAVTRLIRKTIEAAPVALPAQPAPRGDAAGAPS